jgi:hypothetical protein
VCINLHLPDGRVLASFYELRVEMGGEWPPIQREYSYLESEGIPCICPVDLDACALVMGWRLEWKDGDPYATRRCDA